MTAYRFRLQKVLDWRTRMDIEEARYWQALAAEGVHTEAEVRSWNPMTERDVEAGGHAVPAPKQ